MKYYIVFVAAVCLFLGQLGFAAVDCQKSAAVHSQDLPGATWLLDDPNQPDPNEVPE